MKNYIRVFSTFEEENKAEDKRRATATVKERWKEFEILMERRWGKN